MVGKPLNDSECAALRGVAFDEGAFREWMKQQKISAGNIKRIMEAVYKLENDGVYEPQGRVKGGFFAGGVNATGSKLSMSQNFGRLRELSRDWLPSSKDPSNGWVINHVLNKLIDFQRMLYGHCNDNDDDDTVECVGERTREERTREGRLHAIELSDDESDEPVAPTPKRAKRNGSAVQASSGSEMTEVFSKQLGSGDAYEVKFERGVLRVFVRSGRE